MHATLAQIHVAYIVTYGVALPKDKPFVDAGNEMLKHYGDKAMARLLRQCQAAITANPYPATYEFMAERVVAVRTINKG
jgi:hypothetical protein